MTIIEQLQSAQQRIKTLEALLSTKATATATTSGPAPAGNDILATFKAMPEGAAKQAFKKSHWAELCRAQKI